MSFTENYTHYRWFFTSTGLLVVGGKSAVQNDVLLQEVLARKGEYCIMHTEDPGSPFTIIDAQLATLSQQDYREVAIFTACFSKAWKAGKKQAIVHLFSSSQIHKQTAMKAGTWGVYGNVQKLSVPLQLALIKQKGKLRAVPPSLVTGKKKQLYVIPGTTPKEELLPKIELELDSALAADEVLQALPAGRCKVYRE